MTITNERLINWATELQWVRGTDLVKLLSQKKVDKFVRQNGKLVQKVLDEGFEIHSKYYMTNGKDGLMTNEQGGFLLRDGLDEQAFHKEYDEFKQRKVTVEI